MKTSKSDEVIFKVKFCLFAKPVYMGGNYQSTKDKLPLNYSQSTADKKGGIELAIWKDGLSYITAFGSNGSITIIPLNNVAGFECEELSEEDKKKYSKLI